MLPYVFLFSVIAVMSATLTNTYVTTVSLKKDNFAWFFITIFLTLVIGFRQEVGGDWFNYLEHIGLASELSLWGAMAIIDPAYGFLDWVGSIFGGIYLVNLICAAIFSYGLVKFCRQQYFPWLALLVSIPYLVTVVSMGYTRQSVAIGITMIALADLEEKGIRRFFILLVIASLFHKSAVMLAPMAAFYVDKFRWNRLVVAIIVFIALFVVFMLNSIDTLQIGYLDQEYQSSGAAIRITMNAFPAIFFLIYGNHFNLSKEESNFWKSMSWGAIALIFFLIVSPSSTAVDRIALYWIPIQPFVWSRLPLIFGKTGESNFIWIFALILTNGLVMFSWLFFAETAFMWVPYRFFPWEWFWS